MEHWVIYILNGLYFASFLFLTSLGLSIILGVMGILNLAHGSLFAIGAFVLGLLILINIPLGGLATMLLVFALLSLAAYLGMRRVFGLKAGSVKIWDRDIND